MGRKKAKGAAPGAPSSSDAASDSAVEPPAPSSTLTRAPMPSTTSDAALEHMTFGAGGGTAYVTSYQLQAENEQLRALNAALRTRLQVKATPDDERALIDLGGCMESRSSLACKLLRSSSSLWTDGEFCSHTSCRSAGGRGRRALQMRLSVQVQTVGRGRVRGSLGSALFQVRDSEGPFSAACAGKRPLLHH